jgi:hypothetical protein
MVELQPLTITTPRIRTRVKIDSLLFIFRLLSNDVQANGPSLTVSLDPPYDLPVWKRFLHRRRSFQPPCIKPDDGLTLRKQIKHGFERVYSSHRDLDPIVFDDALGCRDLGVRPPTLRPLPS